MNEPVMRHEERHVQEFSAQGFQQRNEELEGWPVRITSYALEDRWYCKVDNVSPGATIARSEADTREAAESAATAKARDRLKATRRISG
jgi:hypothetical protein